MGRVLKIVAYLFGTGVILAIAGVALVAGAIWYYGRDLPDHTELANYAPATVTRVYAGDGRLLAEYAREKRVFVPIEAVPLRVKAAFLSAEDKSFYQHPGVDFVSVAGAVVANLRNLGADRRPVGASTITQQVAKNFLLSNEISIERKIKEAILAFRIERALSKDEILELYLNEIYLGRGSYGVASAALSYFDKSLDELTWGEAAFLAALPKAPNNYNPETKYEAAVARRNWVVGRMLEDQRIGEEAAEIARTEPIVVERRDIELTASAEYFAEDVRREVVRMFGEDALYEGGLSVRTTLDPHLQALAEQSLREGLIDYDRRHGWRGPLRRLELPEGSDGPAALEALRAQEPPPGAEPWRQALVAEVSNNSARLRFADGTGGVIPFDEMSWARPWRPGQRVGTAPKRPRDVLAVGDVILVEALDTEAGDSGEGETPRYALRQMPEVDGGLVALDPHTGRVLALAGGFAYARSEFNRVSQALRQPGSSFKPFVYLTALENGLTPATLILDAPFEIDQGAGLGIWRPKNYSGRTYGPTPMRLGIEKSRNLMTVRLANTVGMDRVVDTARKFGIDEDMAPVLAMALGSGETTLLDLASAYGMLVNGGKRIEPSLIDRIQDRKGRTILRHDERVCETCRAEAFQGALPPVLPDDRETIADPVSTFQVVSMLQGVIQRGTGRRIASLGRPLAGKTGTTNDNRDAWFVGFSPDLVAGVFVGFDEPKPLGSKETGSQAAAPIFKSFMGAALSDAPIVPFRVPPGVHFARIHLASGQVARSGGEGVILEAFKPGSVPSGQMAVLDGGYDPARDGYSSAPGQFDPARDGYSAEEGVWGVTDDGRQVVTGETPGGAAELQSQGAWGDLPPQPASGGTGGLY